MPRHPLLITTLPAFCSPGFARAQEAARPARPIPSEKRRRAGSHATV
ncbi:hypothetical protein APY03_4209 [Variovorax sp. WDL1]|nr:hypothetical protein APY03_4209 [Variovorax sp. WDL1]